VNFPISQNGWGVDTKNRRLANEILDGGGLTAAEAAVAAKVSRRTVTHWERDGTPNRHTGETVVLESILVGNAYVTSRQALERFLVAVNDPPAPKAAPVSRRKAARDDADDAILERLGAA
jgi:hypothetical protein